jgi:hypothetical protein
VPNKSAKLRKQNRLKLNKKWAREGRTANQHKKYKAKLKKLGINPNQTRYR